MHVPGHVCIPWVLGCVGVVDVNHAGLVPGEVHVVHLVRGPEDRLLVTHHLAVDVVHDIIVCPHPDTPTGYSQHRREDSLPIQEACRQLEVPCYGREVCLQLDWPLPGIVFADSSQVILLSLRIIRRCVSSQCYHLSNKQ